MEIKIEVGGDGGKEKKNRDAFEFDLPVDEVQQDLEVGQRGYVRLPVEVISKHGGLIHFRKRAAKATSDSWTQQSLQDVEDDIGMADESKRE